MRVERLHVGLIMVGLGLVLSITGMVSYTGILNLGVPVFFMYLGDLLVIASMVLLYFEFRKYEPLVEEYNAVNRIHEMLTSVPDDDYLIDFTEEAEKNIDPFTLQPIDSDEKSELIDLTK